MNTMTIFFLLLGGFALLFIGGELLIRGAARLAIAAGISPLIVGLTVVAFSTSAPELAVTVQSVLAGQTDLALGNVVGSNISNVLLILGLSALIAPLMVAQKLIRLDVPLMIGISVALWLLARDHQIERWEGFLLVTGIAAYVVFAIRESRNETKAVETEYRQEYGHEHRQAVQIGINLAFISVGIGLLVLGANWLVEGAVAVARALGLSELIIGLTIIAVGTSLPELATSLLATIRNQRDIAVGNVIGSNIFNILSVLGLTAIVAPGGITVPAAALNFDIPVMVFAAAACLPIFFNGTRIARWEGGLFLGYYVIYVAYLALASSQHAALPAFNAVLLWFILPLTLVTLGVVTVGEIRKHRENKK